MVLKPCFQTQIGVTNPVCVPVLYILIDICTPGPKVPSAEEQNMTLHLQGEYETEASAMCNNLVKAEWNYNIDLANPANEENLVSL